MRFWTRWMPARIRSPASTAIRAGPTAPRWTTRLQPYRLFIPESYDGSKTTPLVVALHGMGGDENSMFDSYANGLLKREAERVGLHRGLPEGPRFGVHVSGHGGAGCAGRDGGCAAQLPHRCRAHLSDGPFDGRLWHVEHRDGSSRDLRRARPDLGRRQCGRHGEDPPHPAVRGPRR